MKLRQVFKWTGEYKRIVQLARKRGSNWGVKHRGRYLWLRSKVRSIKKEAERFVGESL